MQEIADRYKRKGTAILFPVVTAKGPHEQWRQYDAILHRNQLQSEEVERNDGTRLSAEPHRRKAFLGEHDEERKHKRHPVK